MSHRRRRKRLESAAFTGALMAVWAVVVIATLVGISHHP